MLSGQVKSVLKASFRIRRILLWVSITILRPNDTSTHAGPTCQFWPSATPCQLRPTRRGGLLRVQLPSVLRVLLRQLSFHLLNIRMPRPQRFHAGLSTTPLSFLDHLCLSAAVPRSHWKVWMTWRHGLGSPSCTLIAAASNRRRPLRSRTAHRSR